MGCGGLCKFMVSRKERRGEVGRGEFGGGGSKRNFFFCVGED